MVAPADRARLSLQLGNLRGMVQITQLQGYRSTLKAPTIPTLIPDLRTLFQGIFSL